MSANPPGQVSQDHRQQAEVLWPTKTGLVFRRGDLVYCVVTRGMGNHVGNICSQHGIQVPDQSVDIDCHRLLAMVGPFLEEAVTLSLGVAIKGPEGIVLATESRLTVTGQLGGSGITVQASYDHATKLFSFSDPHRHVGAVTYGQGTIGNRSAFSFVPEFENSLESDRLSIEDFAQEMSRFYSEQWNDVMPDDFPGPGMTFIVGGFDENEAYGRVYIFEIPNSPEPEERNPDTDDGETQFGITWGGQREFVDRLLRGYDHRVLQILKNELGPEKTSDLEQKLDQLGMKLPLGVMPLQDCVDAAILFLRTTIDAQRLTLGIRGCGGAIEVATLTRTAGFQSVQQKTIRGERRASESEAY